VRASIFRQKIVILAALILAVTAFALLGYRHMQDGPLKKGEAGVPKLARFPVYGEDYSHQTFETVNPMNGKSMSFEVKLKEGSVLEVGVVRVQDTAYYWSYPGKFRFRVYRESGFRKETLFETVRMFAVNERASFQIKAKTFAKETGHQVIVCEIEKEGRDKAKGYEAYKDFKFLVPVTFDRRMAGDFNVLLISFDTLRADHLGCYGYQRDTSPNIDAFAEEGIRFSQAISPAPWTTPAHFSLLTALYPSAHQNRKALEVPPYLLDRTLVNTFRENGYYTLAITGGVLISSEFGFASGFNVYREYASFTSVEPPSTQDDTRKIFDEAITWLTEHADTKFLMFLHNYECHSPFESDIFVSEEVGDDPIEQRIARYDGDIRHADSHFGRLIRKLDSLNLMSNTIVVVLSDHGEDFHDHYRESDTIRLVAHGHSLYDELIRVPLIFHVPGLRPAWNVLENQVGLIDVMPTILDYLNMEYEGLVQGTSLLGLMRTGMRETDPPAISEFTCMGPYRTSIRKDGYKYIWIHDANEILNSAFKGLTQYEMFDLRDDPAEKANIFEQNRQLAHEYHKILEDQLEASRAIYGTLRGEHRPEKEKQTEIGTDVAEALKALGYLQ